jgi:Flp pilus assembly protein TadD
MEGHVQPLYPRLKTALADRYTLLRELGQGGMAVVFLADDLRHGRQVAIKAVRPEVLVGFGAERFEREILIAAGLSHPHIVPLFDSGTADGLLFFVMPYVEGESLRERLRRERQLPLADAVKFGRDIASALACAHAHGVIHRDIKPENILLEGGEARVADFGIAKALSGARAESITLGGLVVGTPAYMSPEQCAGEATLDPRSDLYSLGCLLYEMLTGEPPFTGATTQAVITRQHFDAPTPVTVLRPDVPPALEALVDGLLRKSPDERPQNASEVARALEGSGQHTPMPAGPPARRNWRGLFAVAGAIAGGLTAWWWLTTDRQERDPNRIAVMEMTSATAGFDSARAAGITGALVSSLNTSGVLSAVEVQPGADPAKAAHAVGAGRWIETGLFAGGDSLRLSMTIHAGRGSAPSLRPLVLPADAEDWLIGYEAAGRLVGGLLAAAGDVDQAPVALLEGRSPAALAQFFLGEDAYRRASFEDAMAHYRAALAEDSTFAYVALRAALVAQWLFQDSLAASFAAAADAHSASLPRKHAVFAQGLVAYQAGQADTAVSRFREALAIDPADPNGWMALGEVYSHLLPRLGSLDSLAEDAFLRVHRLHKDFAPALPHLIEAALRRGDTTAGTLLAEFRRGDPDPDKERYLQLAVRCVADGVDRMRWAADSGIFSAAEALTAGGLRQAGCAGAAWDAADAADPAGPWHFATLLMRQGILVTQGDSARARILVESDTTLVRGGLLLLLTLDAVAGAPYAAEADSLADGVLRRIAAAAPGNVSNLNLWLAGIWLARRGRVEDAGTVAARAAAQAPGSSVTRSLDARVLLARGDTSAAIAALEQNPPHAPKSMLSWFPNESLIADRILLAQLLLARGQAWDAIDWASSVDAPAVLADIVFLPASLNIRIEAATVVGDQRLARESRRRLANLRPATQQAGP